MSLLQGMGYSDSNTASITERLYARQRFLQQKRKVLGWSVEDIAKRIGVLPSEYEAYETGRKDSLEEIDFEDIQYYLHSHIKTMGLDGRVNMEGHEK
jgi:DNA-binding XRE family transcriptional regulator